jgi:hypothetical protein
MMNWILISFYTIGTGYEKEIKGLERSLKEFDIDYYFFRCESKGSWRKNLNYKSQVIMEAFDKYLDRDIVFVDADAIVRQYPVLFDDLSNGKDYDMAAHFHPYRGTRMHGGSLLSGTLWFKNSYRGRRIVKEWHAIGLGHPTIRHQHCLRLAVAELRIKRVMMPNVYKLPAGYTLIFDYYGRFRGPKPKAVIEHFQASRRFRRQVGPMEKLLDSSFTTLAHKGRKERKPVRLNRVRMRKDRMLTTRAIKVTHE